MSVYILGSSGMLGSYMYSYLSKFHDCIGLTREHFDATNTKQKYLNNKLRDNDIVINCVGILKPDIDKTGVSSTILTNSVFPQIVADVCSIKNAKFIHISSDCVFSGNRGKYSEQDVCDAVDLYARTKSIEPSNSLTLRTSFVGEDLNPDGKGLLSWLISKKNSTVDGYTNCMWNGVTCLQLCKIVNNILIKDQLNYMLRHIHSPHAISKYTLCDYINTVYKLNIKINKKAASHISGTKIKNILDRSLTSIYTMYSMPEIKQQILEQYRYEM